MMCKKCGQQIEKAAKVCVKCGAKIARPDAYALATAGKVPLVDDGDAEKGLIYAWPEEDENQENPKDSEEQSLEDGAELSDEAEMDADSDIESDEADLSSSDSGASERTVEPAVVPIFPQKRRRAWRNRAIQLFYAASVFLALVLGLFGGYYLASRNNEESAGNSNKEIEALEAIETAFKGEDMQAQWE
ncbi:MAG: zinc ribbon domain-containing protein [Clostridiales bacterium]|jgi:hypothetical protein|nr:zinc ribbon domain-containing protein [Clostridiales bacterium]